MGRRILRIDTPRISSSTPIPSSRRGFLIRPTCRNDGRVSQRINLAILGLQVCHQGRDVDGTAGYSLDQFVCRVSAAVLVDVFLEPTV